MLNKLFPQTVDWIMGHWVRRHRKEAPDAEQTEPARYPGSASVLPLLAGIFAVLTVFRFLRKKG
jgi:hypothetical protein